MSQENVGVVQRLVAALNERDADGYLGCCTNDVALRTALVGIEGVHEGAEGIRSFLTDLQDTAPDFQLEVERLDIIGPDRILAFERATASGRTSGIRLDESIPFWTVGFTGHKIKRIRVFVDQQEALEAVGLSEQDANADS
jgi:ketosteroid isomerase-like protein